MNILCVNTAFSEAHIALMFNGYKYFSSMDSNSKHSENLLCSIEQIFNKAIKHQNLSLSSHDILKQLNVFSCVIGPGSFTGLRISISTVKAIITTLPNSKIVAIDTLELLNYEYQKSKKSSKATPILDALSGLYFIAEYNGLNCLTPPKMIEKESLKNYNHLISNDASMCSNLVKLTPESLLELTLVKVKSNQFTPESELVPLYLRPSQAEAQLQCRLKK